jgi:hypothetical protein
MIGTDQRIESITKFFNEKICRLITERVCDAMSTDPNSSLCKNFMKLIFTSFGYVLHYVFLSATNDECRRKNIIY